MATSQVNTPLTTITATTSAPTPQGEVMHKSRPPTTRTTYQLLEPLPYPRAQRPGSLVDAFGVRLHGVYERRIDIGHRSAVVNNGSILHWYTHPLPSPAPRPSDRHSYANVVLAGGDVWGVSDACTRPVTLYPATEYPLSVHRPLWNSFHVQQRLLAGVKPAGRVSGTPEQVAAWRAEAEAAGLVSRALPSRLPDNGLVNAVAVIARPGPVLVGDERQDLEDAYRGLFDDVFDNALDELDGLTGEDLLQRDLANPRGTQELIIAGHAFGYPPSTSVACIFGTHG